MDPATPTACPDFDTLNAHANGYLDDDATAAIEQHLAQDVATDLVAGRGQAAAFG